MASSVTAAVLAQVAGSDEAEIFRAPFSLSDPTRLRSLLAETGFESIEMRRHDGAA